MSRVLLDADPTLRSFSEEIGETGAVAIAGARTRWAVGGESLPGTRIVTAPSGIVSHRPEEMTVVVRAGTPVAELDDALAATGQRCALPDRGGTVGGAVMVGEHHLEVLGRGTVRASVLEVRYVSAEGRLIRGGGPTVKNVSGFDLPRLLTGSLGTLGMLAEVVLRTNPVPRAEVWLRIDEPRLEVLRGLTASAAAVLWNGEAAWTRLAGHPDDVARLRQRLAHLHTVADADGPPPLPAHRWSLPPGEAVGLDPQVTGHRVVSVGVGTVFADRPQPVRRPDPAAATVAGRLKGLFDPTHRLNPGRDPGTAR